MHLDTDWLAFYRDYPEKTTTTDVRGAWAYSPLATAKARLVAIARIYETKLLARVFSSRRRATPINPRQYPTKRTESRK